MKHCKNCVYLKKGLNFAYCMFFKLPNCPNDDGRPAPIVADKQQEKVQVIKEQIQERGIEIPEPYNRRPYAWRFDYFEHHKKIFNLFYFEGFTYQDIADELGEGATSKGVRAYIMKCEAWHDERRRLAKI